MAATVGALGVVGCGSNASLTRLVDRSSAPARPTALRTLDRRVVTTRVQTLAASKLRPTERSCLDRFPAVTRSRDTAVVVRTGVVGSSVTFEDSRGRYVYGCDATGERRAEGRRWCSVAVGQLRGHRLLDPRLGLGCRDRLGSPVGFAWIEPVARARWIVVRERSYAEVYEAAAELPIRVTTAGVDASTSSAELRIAQYDADGSPLTTYTLETVVAG